MVHKFIKNCRNLIFSVILTILILLSALYSVLLFKTIIIPSSSINQITSFLGLGIEMGEVKLSLKKNVFSIINIESNYIKLNKEHQINLENLNVNIHLLKFYLNAYAKIQETNILSIANFIKDEKSKKLFQKITENNLITFNGTAYAKFKLIGLESVELKLTSNNGWHYYNHKEKIKVKECYLHILYQNDQLIIKDLKLLYDNNFSINSSGSFIFKHSNLIAAKYNVDLNNLEINHLSSFWIGEFFPLIRQWIIQNITKGFITHAHANFDFDKDDLNENMPLKDTSIKAEINIKEGELIYLPEYPPIKNIDAKFIINSTKLHITNAQASLMDHKISELELDLSFDKLILSLKSKFSGSVKNLNDFIPKNIHSKLKKYSINFNDINGSISGLINLSIPIDKDSDIRNINLDLKAELRNVHINKINLLDLKHANLLINNSSDKIKISITENNRFSINIEDFHDEINNHQDHFKVTTTLAAEQFPNIKSLFHVNKGNVILSLDINQEKWLTSINFSNAEIDFFSLNYLKPINDNLTITCSGESNEHSLLSNDCLIKGKDLAGNAQFEYLYEKSSLTHLYLSNIKIGHNIFSLKKTNLNNLIEYNINAKNLDLSNFTSLLDGQDSDQNYQLSVNIENLILKNNIVFKKTTANISKHIGKPIDINLKSLSDSDQFYISKVIKNGKAIYSLYSSSAAIFSKAFGIYDNIKNGQIWIELTPTEANNKISYGGTLLIKNFAFTNTSILTKIILGIMAPFNSPYAIAQTLQGGSIKAESFKANLNYNQGIFSLENGVIDGASYNIKLKGIVDVSSKTLDFKGIYIPSTYGINRLISSIPLLGKILSGGDDSAFFAANFGIKGNFSNPKTAFNPLSIFTPGFTRKFFN
jgi:hypothetical protein